MASPLQKVPPGLLGLLDLKTIGRNPFLFSDQLVPTLDTLDLYSFPRREALNASFAGASTSQTLTLPVPPGQIWLLRNVSALLDFTGVTITSDSVRTNVEYVSSTVMPAVLAWRDALAANAPSSGRWLLGATFERPLVLGPGFAVRMNASLSVSAGTISGSLFAHVDVLDI